MVCRKAVAFPRYRSYDALRSAAISFAGRLVGLNRLSWILVPTHPFCSFASNAGRHVLRHAHTILGAASMSDIQFIAPAHSTVLSIFWNGHYAM